MKLSKKRVYEKLTRLESLAVEFDELSYELICWFLSMREKCTNINLHEIVGEIRSVETDKTWSTRNGSNYVFTSFVDKDVSIDEPMAMKFFSTYINDFCELVPPPVSWNTVRTHGRCIISNEDLANHIRLYVDSHFLETAFDYYSKDFRKLRLEVFTRDGEICGKCGAIPEKGTSLTIDHIKPVSKYPELGLDIDNLQVLCWECNQGKSNKHNTDYRIKD